MNAGAAMLRWHQNGGIADWCLVAKCRVKSMDTALACLYKTATICLTNLDSAWDCTHQEGQRKRMENWEALSISCRANDGALAKSVPLELYAYSLALLYLSPPLPLSLVVCVSVFTLSTGLPEEWEGQRPPVSHRGVSPQGQYLRSFWLVLRLKKSFRWVAKSESYNVGNQFKGTSRFRQA